MRQFRVVTHRNWLAAQFAPMGAVQDFGFDIDPTTAAETLWWAPSAWVASAMKAGVRLPLMSCGPDWLRRLNRTHQQIDVVGRRTCCIPLGRILNSGLDQELWGDGQVFVKLPESKVESFPAQLFNVRHIGNTLKQFHLPHDTLLQVQEVCNFQIEARFWVAHGEVTTASYYRIVGGDEYIWGGDKWDELVACMKPVMDTEMAQLANLVASARNNPPGYVVDCGVTTGGDVFVVEANAAWSSGPYDGDPAGIVRAIEASHDFSGEHPRWAWSPNAALERVGPLHVRVSG